MQANSHPPQAHPAFQDRLVLLLTNGMSIEAAEGYCTRQGGMDADAARQAVAEARKRLTIAADYARDEQLGKAVMRLDDLYAKRIADREQWTDVTARGRTVREWSPKPSRPDNHWLDCLVGCAIAASHAGIRTASEAIPTRNRKRYTKHDLRRR